MSHDEDPNGPYLNGKPPAVPKRRDYEVGRGKPPKNTRFQKGQSGNRRGRPKGAKTKPKEGTMMELLQQEAARMVVVNDGEDQITLTMSRTVIRTLLRKGAKGDVAAMRLFFEMMHKSEQVAATVDNREIKSEIIWTSWTSVCGIRLTKEEIGILRQHRERKAEEEARKPNPSAKPQALLDEINNPKWISLNDKKKEED